MGAAPELWKALLVVIASDIDMHNRILSHGVDTVSLSEVHDGSLALRYPNQMRSAEIVPDFERRKIQAEYSETKWMDARSCEVEFVWVGNKLALAMDGKVLSTKLASRLLLEQFLFGSGIREVRSNED